MIKWAEGVNQNILRESSWELPARFIEDDTRSGKKKRRSAFTLSPVKIKCVLHMTMYEYELFEKWYEYDCRGGAESFALPKINGFNKNDLREYRFSKESISVSNVGGDTVEINFTVEEVR